MGLVLRSRVAHVYEAAESKEEVEAIDPPGALVRRKTDTTSVILIDEVMDYFTCPVCFDEINKCYMTACGHNFCEECIKECINLKHVCPLCNAEATVGTLIRNHHLDAVIGKLQRARDEAAQDYVARILKSAVAFAAADSKSKTGELDADMSALSPIADIFAKATATTLVKFENYYQSLLRDRNIQIVRRKDELREECVVLLPFLASFDSSLKKALVPSSVAEIEPMSPPPLDPTSSSHSASAMEAMAEERKQAAEKQMESVVMSAMAEMEWAEEGSVSDFGTQQKAQELFLSILQCEHGDDMQAFIAQLSHLCKDFVAFVRDNLTPLGLAASSVSSLVVESVEASLLQLAESIQRTEEQFVRSKSLLLKSYEEYMFGVAPSPFLLPVSVTIRLRGRRQHWDGVSLKATDPLSRVFDIVKNKFQELGNPIEAFKEGEVMSLGLMRPLSAEDDAKGMDMEVISQLDKCVKEYSLRPGSTIHVLTQFTLASEAPRPCFTFDYEKGKGLKTDYFKCLTCGFKWVCQPCAAQCHKGHELTLFMKDHAPSYACCYCMKKKTCRIENRKTKKRRR